MFDPTISTPPSAFNADVDDPDVSAPAVNCEVMTSPFWLKVIDSAVVLPGV